MSEKAAALLTILDEARIQLGTFLVPNAKGSLRRTTSADTGWFCDWLTRYEALLAAESQRTQAPSTDSMKVEQLEFALKNLNSDLCHAVSCMNRSCRQCNEMQRRFGPAQEGGEGLLHAGTQAQAAFQSYLIEVSAFLSHEFGEHFPGDRPRVDDILTKTEKLLRKFD